MVARLKLKGIDGRAPPGVEPAALNYIRPLKIYIYYILLIYHFIYIYIYI
jgi:hypothetical protein